MRKIKNIKRDILWRVYLLYFFVLLFGVAIVIKLIYIQYNEGEALLKKAQKQELKFFNLDASRGNIYAEDGNLLATSIPIFDIRMDVDSDNISDKLFFSNIDSLSYQLSKLFPAKSKAYYKQKLSKARKNGNRFLLLAKKVNYEQLQKIKTFPILRLGKFKGGLIVIPKTIRQMPYGDLAKRTIGYKNIEENLFVGLEGAYADVIQGVNGKQLKRRINNGDWIPVNNEDDILPVDGKDIITTINVNLQDVAENALHQHLTDHAAFQGCAILMEVATGQIKAIANLRYDSTSQSYEESYNFAVGESVEPGSTFKLLSLMSALEHKKFNLTDSVETGEGYTVFYDRTMKDAHKIGDGKLSVRQAFEMSSNVGISRLIYEAYKEKPEEFIQFIYDIPMNQKLGVEIQGEGRPVIKHPSQVDRWYGTSLPWMSIGYELLLTPLQMLSVYNAVANDGRMVKPMFVKEIRQGGKTLERFKTETINRSICSGKTIDSLKSLLEGVVQRGTASLTLKNTVYKIAGKTGTAQIAKGSRGYNKSDYNASFAGYFPADDPKYSCIVVVNNPTKGRIYGSSVAAPVFKEIADKVYAKQLDIHAREGYWATGINQSLEGKGKTEDLKTLYENFNYHSTLEKYSDWSRFKADSTELELTPLEINLAQVPNVRG
ncbi:MAG: penicillin-binding protein 2, partial [Cytophagales bacterium]|nr:penicillin-binding protein 2 [Cytophagales bacterium]